MLSSGCRELCKVNALVASLSLVNDGCFGVCHADALTWARAPMPGVPMR